MKVNVLICILALSIFGVRCQRGESEILWDTYGVPHIFANTTEEMYYSYGWAQMQNHADLILKLYGQARGRAAEYWGEDFLDSDQKMQLFEIPLKAEKIYQDQEGEFRPYLDAFVAGINKYANEHRDLIDEKYWQVLPVTASDVLGHTLRVICLEFLAAEDIYFAGNVLPKGSNAYAIAPSKSENGHAMLVINPHLPWSDLFLWFEAHLSSPGFNSYGICLVGMPSMTLAFNDNLGWAHTVNPIDASDRYILTLRDEGYLLDGKVVQFEKKRITLKVRQNDGSLLEREIEFNYSIHGPVVGQNNKNAFSVRIAGIDNSRIFEQYHLMAKAKSFSEFESALKMLQNPMFNVIYADNTGNIFYMFNGNIPIREEGDFAFWKGTIDGTESKYIWEHIHPYEDLPKVLNPESGFIQNCNDAPWTCTDPPVLNPLDFPSYFSSRGTFLRPQRAVNMITDNPSVSYEQLVTYKHNTGMEAADRFLDDLLVAVGKYPDSLSLEAAEVLESWDRQTETSSRGAVLYAKWWDKVRSSLFEIPWNPDDPFRTPDGIKEEKRAVELLKIAASEVKTEHGSLDVAWGDVYRLRINDIDLPANGGPGDYGIFRTLYFADDIDHKKRAIAGETFVAVVEFGDTLRANVVLGYGNASQPGNPHVGDQLHLLSEKKLRPALMERKQILHFLEESVLLSPEETKHTP